MKDARGTTPLILLTGMGRSGTSWLGKIFDSHPGTLYRNEPESEIALKDIPTVTDGQNGIHYGRTLEAYLSRLPGMRSANTTGSLPVFRKECEPYLQYRLRRGLVVSAKAAEKVVAGIPMPQLLSRAQMARLRLVWKSISALRQLDAFLKGLPTVNSVLVVRHPCGVLASRIRAEKKGLMRPLAQKRSHRRLVERMLDTEYAEGLGIGRSQLDELKPSEMCVLLWALSNAKAMSDLEGVPGCMVLRYEDLCSDPIGVCREAFSVAGLEWHGQTERFIRKSTSRDSSRYYSVFKDPERTANAWREELPETEQSAVAVLLSESLPGRLYYEN